MSFSAGTQLGPYEVVSLIGAGGMGEVYKARDLRLGRDVAVKVLPASFSADPERLRRFEQEARAVASLSHPNILAVHDIGQYERQPFMVSELLEGESLRELLLRGALPQRKAIDYGVQIAHGLAAAHSKDIAHRDLKPDNIFITREGRVKILDFGLAKTVQKTAAQRVDDGLTSMTALSPATDLGAVVGTVGYMSPEQVRGGVIDGRSDIFSFGAVLYEMLTGLRAFKRDTAAETMTAILKDEPPELSLVGSTIPPALERTVRHCLEKAPEQRFQSARDLAFDLESFSTLTPNPGIAAAGPRRNRRWGYALAALALLGLGGLAASRITLFRHAATEAQFRQLTFRRGSLDNGRFSPDGQNILYTAGFEGGAPEIYTVPVKGVGGHSIGISNARLLAVSSRGELAVALTPHTLSSLLTPGNLARTFAEVGAPKPEIANVQAADFTPDGTAMAIVRCVSLQKGCQVEYPIGKVLYRENAIDDLRFSPDGKYLAFIPHTNAYDDRGPIVILRSSGEMGATSRIFESAAGLAWSRSSDEVWISSPLESGNVFAFSVSGKERVPLGVPGRLRIMDVAQNGQLLVSQGLTRRGMVVSTQNEKVERDLSWLDFTYGRAISGDGKMILFEEEGSESEGYTVYVRNTDGSPAVPIGEGYGMALSPDKNWALAEKLTQPAEVWLLPVGPGEGRRLSPPNLDADIVASFLSDSKSVVYIAHEPGKRLRTWLQALDGSAPHPITEEGRIGSQISPDDKTLLSYSDVSLLNGFHPMLVPIAGGSPRTIPGGKPGDQLLGWASDGQLYVVAAQNHTDAAVGVEKLNPQTGARKFWREIANPTIGGISAEGVTLTPDGASYYYTYRLTLTDLYTVDGVR